MVWRTPRNAICERVREIRSGRKALEEGTVYVRQRSERWMLVVVVVMMNDDGLSSSAAGSMCVEAGYLSAARRMGQIFSMASQRVAVGRRTRVHIRVADGQRWHFAAAEQLHSHHRQARANPCLQRPAGASALGQRLRTPSHGIFAGKSQPGVQEPAAEFSYQQPDVCFGQPAIARHSRRLRHKLRLRLPLRHRHRHQPSIPRITFLQKAWPCPLLGLGQPIDRSFLPRKRDAQARNKFQPSMILQPWLRGRLIRSELQRDGLTSQQGKYTVNIAGLI